MKVAILLTGNIRTWDQTKKSFLDTFSHLTPDVFVSTYHLRYGYHEHIRGVISDHDDNILTNDEISEHFRHIVKVIKVNAPVEEEFKARLHPNFREQDNTIGQVARLNDCIDLMQESAPGVHYDIVIKTRCDLLYNPIKFDIDFNKHVLIDSGNVFPNDCMYATSYENMIKIARFMHDEIHEPKYANSHEKAPHQLLHNAVIDSGLAFEQRPIIAGVVRKGNKVQVY